MRRTSACSAGRPAATLRSAVQYRYSARNGNAAAQLGRSSIERRRALSLSPVCRHPRVLTSEAQPRQLCSAPQQGVSRLLVGELIVAVLRNKTKRKKKGDFCHKIQNTV